MSIFERYLGGADGEDCEGGEDKETIMGWKSIY